MDKIWLTIALIYLIGVSCEFLYLTKLDKAEEVESSFVRDVSNFVESALWPIVIPVGVLFVILSFLFEIFLDALLTIHRIIRGFHGK